MNWIGFVKDHEGSPRSSGINGLKRLVLER